MIRLGFHPLRKALRLSLNEMAVLVEIHTLSNNTKFSGFCIKSKKNIADTLDISEKTVFNIINTLIEKEYIDKDNETGYLKPSEFIREIDQSNDYAILIQTENYAVATSNFSKIIEDKYNSFIQQKNEGYVKITEGMKKLPKDYVKITEGVCKNYIGGMKKLHTSISLSKSISNNSNNKELSIFDKIDESDVCEQNEPTAEQVLVTKIDSAPTFGEFWSAYPRKTQKVVAEKAWGKLKSEEKFVALEKIVDFCKGKELQFIAHPSTYINQKRWEDEVIEPTKKFEQTSVSKQYVPERDDWF
jgi:hypothetical protein